MPLTYDGSDGLFTRLGALIARIDSYNPIADTDLPADLATLIAAFGDDWKPAEGLATYYGGLQDAVTGWRRGLARYADSLLTDFDTVLSQLSVPLPQGSDLQAVLSALHRDTRIDGETVQPCACSVGSVTPLAGNVGTGNAFVTLTLDGFNAPLAGGAARTAYEGLASELTVPAETMTLECVADSVLDGLTAGDELWGWTGAPAYSELDWRDEGSGQGPTLRTDNGESNLLTNAALSNWTGNLPVGWTLDSGTVGVSLVQDGAAAKFVGAGAGVITLSQTINSSVLNSKRRYRSGALVKMSGATAGTLTVQLAGGTSLVVNCSALPTSYGLRSVFSTVASPVPTTAKLTFSVSGLNAGAFVWVTLPSVAPTVYHGGLGVNVAAGATAWQRGDRLSWTVANDEAGKFQSWFRRWWKTQLPSNASETISDALVA